MSSNDDRIKRKSARKHQNQIRRAKSFVISIIGEFFKTCQSNEVTEFAHLAYKHVVVINVNKFKFISSIYQVNLEARVGLSSGVGRGLTEEANAMGADYLIIGGNRKNRSEREYSFMKILCKNISRIRLTLLSTRTGSSSTSTYCCQNVPEGCSFVRVQTTQGSSSLNRN